MPALIVGSGLAVLAVFAYSDNSGFRARLIESQYAEARQVGDLETAQLVLNRRLSWAPDDTESRYDLAVLRAEDDKEQAIQMMNQLALTKSFVPAAKWVVAKEFQGRQWSDLDDDERARFGALLKLIRREEPQNRGNTIMLSKHYLVQKQYNEAIELLDELSELEPLRSYDAAQIARRVGDQEMSDRFNRKCLERILPLLEENPSNAALARAVAQVLVDLKRFEEAATRVRRAMVGIANKKETTDKEKKQLVMLRMTFGECMVLWAKELEENGRGTDTEAVKQLQILELALRNAPESPKVLSAVVDQVLANINRDDAKTKAQLKALVDGSSPGISNFIRGTAMLMRDEPEKALNYLRQASEYLPRSNVILNNMAVAMISKGDENLEVALDLVNEAITNSKKPLPHFYETRGQIYFQLDRPNEAISDLQRVLQVPTLEKQARKTLVDCYREIGDEQLASLHLERVQEMQKQEELQSFMKRDSKSTEGDVEVDSLIDEAK
ncbi:MAG: hypothetical protein AAF958_07660 [Planctomycetota bacterium]